MRSEFGPRDTRTLVDDDAFNVIAQRQLETLLGFRDKIRAIRIDCMTPEFVTKFYLPCDVSRLLDRCARIYRRDNVPATALAPPTFDAKECDDLLWALCEMIGGVSFVGIVDPAFSQHVTLALRASIMAAMCVRKMFKYVFKKRASTLASF